MAALPLAAQVSDIAAAKLPDTPAVKQEYTQADRLWPIAGRYSIPWVYSTPKAVVKAQLEKLLAEAAASAQEASGNEAMQLLAGEIGAEAYNLDVTGAAPALIGALGRAAKLAPHDLRPAWMRASYQCGTGSGMVAAMRILLNLESKASPGELTAGFWSDYLNCAAVTFIPEHALRAADQLRKLHALSSLDSEVAGGVERQIIVPDAASSYPPAAFWQVLDRPQGTLDYSTACGLAYPHDLGLEIELQPMEKNTCALQIIPTDPASAATVVGFLVLLARGASPGQTLAAFAAPFADGSEAKPVRSPVVCPLPSCLGFQSAPDEDGRESFFVAFQSLAPAYPGMRFEEPQAVPTAGGSAKGARYFTPVPHLGRIAPRMNYLVMMATKRRQEAPALADLRKFLMSLVVAGGGSAGVPRLL